MTERVTVMDTSQEEADVSLLWMPFSPKPPGKFPWVFPHLPGGTVWSLFWASGKAPGPLPSAIMISLYLCVCPPSCCKTFASRNHHSKSAPTLEMSLLRVVLNGSYWLKSLASLSSTPQGPNKCSKTKWYSIWIPERQYCLIKYRKLLRILGSYSSSEGQRMPLGVINWERGNGHSPINCHLDEKENQDKTYLLKIEHANQKREP